MYDINIIAKYIYDLNLSNMTHKKLQKLCYYLQAWHLAVSGSRIIDSDFRAWVHGSINMELWGKCRNGFDNLKEIDTDIITNDDKIFIGKIINLYGKNTGDELEQLVCSELPWIIARRGSDYWEATQNLISNNLMKSYYKNLLKRKEIR